MKARRGCQNPWSTSMHVHAEAKSWADIRCLPPSPPPLLRQGRLLTQVHCWIHSSLNPPPSEVTAAFDQACLLLGCWGSKLGSSDRGSRLLTDCAVPQTRSCLLTRCASCRSDTAAPWLKNTLELLSAPFSGGSIDLHSPMRQDSPPVLSGTGSACPSEGGHGLPGVL